MKLKEILNNILGFLLLFFISYLHILFIELEFDLRLWKPETKKVLSFWVFVFFILVKSLSNFFKEYEKELQEKIKN